MHFSSSSLRAGSTYTPTATTFALSLFSQLLDYSYKHLSLLLHSVLSLASKSVHNVEKSDDTEQAIGQGESMIDVLLRNKVDVSALITGSTAMVEESSKSKVRTSTAVEMSSKKQGKTPPQRKNDTYKHRKESKKLPKKRLPNVVNRRRRKRRDDSDSSSEESCGSDSDTRSATSDESLAMLTEILGEDELEMLDSLSDSSSSCDESTASTVKGQTVKQSSPNQSPPKSALSAPSRDHSFTGSPSAKQHKGGRRQIVLAASFNLAPSPQSEKKIETSQVDVSQTKTKSGDQKVVSTVEDMRISSDRTKETGKPLFFGVAQLNGSMATGPLSHIDTATESSLAELMEKTHYQSLLHTVCCLVAEESSLMSLRVFMEWLQSYPIVVAACSQVR